ncbi:MAG: hypothetical protein IJC39_00160, partial [Firmicutes bacterium]|nr:hypothetical protein [Bacillota bacterium]
SGTGTEEHISEYTVDGYNEKAFISMNLPKVERMEIADGDSVKTIGIDPDEPFAVVLPVNVGNIDFFDVNGDKVEVWKNPV